MGRHDHEDDHHGQAERVGGGRLTAAVPPLVQIE